jgi:hypothetical protein
MGDQKRKWTVKYVLGDPKKPIIRRFATESKARAYYKSLFARRYAPALQSVYQES